MELRVADYKDEALLVEDSNMEVINGNQRVHIRKSAGELLADLRGRKIAFDEILSYIKECSMRYENMKTSKKRKRKK